MSDLKMLAHIKRHIINVHVVVIWAAAGILVIQELDADSLSRVGRQVKGHLNPGLIVGGILEKLL